MRTVSREKALLYEKFRLPYAPEMAGDLLGRTGPVEVVADVGAGTGQLGRLFANRTTKVYAVEPDPAMREVGAAAMVGVLNVEFLAATAEQMPLAQDSIDLIVVGNAFHRFRPEACDEFRRILKPRGWIALVTYEFTNRAFADILFGKLAAVKSMAARIDQSWRGTPIHSVFGKGQIHTVSYRQSQREDWTAFFGAACAGIEAPEPGDADFRQFEAINREVFDAFAVRGSIQIDYETRVSFGQPHFP